VRVNPRSKTKYRSSYVPCAISISLAIIPVFGLARWDGVVISLFFFVARDAAKSGHPDPKGALLP